MSKQICTITLLRLLEQTLVASSALRHGQSGVSWAGMKALSERAFQMSQYKVILKNVVCYYCTVTVVIVTYRSRAEFEWKATWNQRQIIILIVPSTNKRRVRQVQKEVIVDRQKRGDCLCGVVGLSEEWNLVLLIVSSRLEANPPNIQQSPPQRSAVCPYDDDDHSDDAHPQHRGISVPSGAVSWC